jgi:hypothetical protein
MGELFIMISAICTATVLVALCAKEEAFTVPHDTPGLLASACGLSARFRRKHFSTPFHSQSNLFLEDESVLA